MYYCGMTILIMWEMLMVVLYYAVSVNFSHDLHGLTWKIINAGKQRLLLFAEVFFYRNKFCTGSCYISKDIMCIFYTGSCACPKFFVG